MAGEAPSKKEVKGPTRSRSFSGVVGRVLGLSRTILKVSGEDDEEEEENSVEEEESDGPEAASAPVGESQGTGRPNLAQSDQPVSHQCEPSLLAIMQQMTQIMANLQADSSSESSRPPAFKTPFMKAPACFDGTQPFKVRSFIQSYQLIFHNVQKTSLKTGRKFFMPLHFVLAGLQNGLSLIFSISLIKTQATFSTLWNYLNLNSSLYMVTQMKSLVSRIRDWAERALIYHFSRGLASRILDQLASHPSCIYSLQDLMDISLELDTRYHERQKEKHNDQEKRPEASKSNYSSPKKFLKLKTSEEEELSEKGQGPFFFIE
ncbi:hypothetical protein O181_028956 [Austropuccinia psidii MF-1]|uniref:Uncharacterized protein n=1 Tax=Austropuccinia psidii MF-1 TaxID=1389203 RepID=A0A9Q3CQ74_9BASI|nr:hypothetical protein [Austropuccinia psidii MF-1]